MTRLLAPPPARTAQAPPLELAQSVRSPVADPASQGPSFRDALADATEPSHADNARPAQDHDDAQPEQGAEETAHETAPAEDAGERAADQTDNTEESHAAEPSPPATQDTPPPSESTDTEPDASADPSPVHTAHDAQATTPSEQPESETSETVELPQAASPQAEAPQPDQPGAVDRASSPVETGPPPSKQAADQPEAEIQQRARAAHAPSAEDQARESIEVATRFDASIRDRIRHAAKVDLAALAAEMLVTPREANAAPTPEGVVIKREQATGAPPRRESEPHTPAARSFTPPASSQPAPPSTAQDTNATPPNATPHPTPTPLSAPAAATQQAADAAAQPSAPSPSSVAAAPVAGAVAASQGRTPIQSFDRAITALRALGADKPSARVKDGTAPRPAQSPGKPTESGKALLAQVSRGLASILRDRGGSLNIRLRPDTLGELKINLRVQGGGVEATFKANNAQARDLLKSNLSTLKDTLESNGVRVDRLRVELDTPRTQDASGPRAESRGHEGDGSPGFDDPSETGGRDGGSRHDRHGSRGGAHGRAPRHGTDTPGDAPALSDPLAGLDAEAIRGADWIGLDTLA